MKQLKSFMLNIEDVNFTFSFDALYVFDSAEDIRRVHMHADYEIFINLEGNVNIQTENKMFSFGPNTLIIVPPFLYHTTYNNVNHTEKENNSLCYHFMIQFGTKKNNENPFLTAIKAIFQTEVISLYLIERKIFKVYCDDLKNTFTGNNISNKSRLHSLLTLIILKISDLSNKRVEQIPEDLHRISYYDEIYKVISESYAKDLKISDVAKSINLGERQTSRIIKKHYGKPFSELLAERRLSVAALLLIKTDYSVTRIASEVNFQTESYFYILFKKHYKTTPLKYRRRFYKGY